MCGENKIWDEKRLLLTTMEPAHYVTDDKKKKLYMCKIYDFMKDGIDIPD